MASFITFALRVTKKDRLQW